MPLITRNNQWMPANEETCDPKFSIYMTNEEYDTIFGDYTLDFDVVTWEWLNEWHHRKEDCNS